MVFDVVAATGNAIDLGNLSNIVDVSGITSQILDKVMVWIKAAGIIAAVIILIQIVSFFMNIVKTRRLGELNERMEVLEMKIDKLLAKKKL